MQTKAHSTQYTGRKRTNGDGKVDGGQGRIVFKGRLEGQRDDVNEDADEDEVLKEPMSRQSPQPLAEGREARRVLVRLHGHNTLDEAR